MNNAILGFVVLAFCSIVGCDRGPRERFTVSFSQPDATVPTSIVPPPPEQPNGLGVCHMTHHRQLEDAFATGWFQAVADRPGASVRIVSSVLYGIKADGTVEQIGGTINWAGRWSRQPWFPPGDAHDSVAVNVSFEVPTNRVLHGGTEPVSLEGYVDVFYTVYVVTEGDAKVQVGIDYRPCPGGVVNEGGTSDWHVGNGVMLSTPDPRNAAADCEPTFHTQVVNVR